MKNKKKLFFSFLIIIFFFLAGFFLIKFQTHTQPPPYQSGGSRIQSVEIGGQNVKVDLALTEAEQKQGLSGRSSLAPNTGMLFVFNQPDKYQFWMPDMNFSIDIIWLTSDMKIDYIKNNATPESYPATFGPGTNDGLAKYVLEVPAGFTKQNNLKVGDGVEFTHTP